MSEPVSKLERLKQDIRYRDRLLGSLIVALIVLGGGYISIPKRLTIYHPPDPAIPQVTSIGTVPLSTVYSFGVVLLERLMLCEKDCELDYRKALDINRPLLTERCYNEFMMHLESNTQLYRNRTRKLIPLDSSVFNVSKVKQLTERKWVVTEQFKYNVSVRGEPLRETTMSYPMNIQKTNMSIELNPYQLQLDCFASDPVRIDKEL